MAGMPGTSRPSRREVRVCVGAWGKGPPGTGLAVVYGGRWRRRAREEGVRERRGALVESLVRRVRRQEGKVAV